MRVLRPSVGVWARLFASVVVAATAWCGSPRPVEATTTGGGAISGTMSLDTFPCYIGGCGGTIAGTAVLSLSGLGTATISGLPVPYTAAWAPPASSFTAGFSYKDTCELGQPDGTVPITTDPAGGTFTLSGGSVSIGGGPLMSATLTGGYQFVRQADAMRVSLTNLVLTPASGSPVIAVNLTAALAGQSAAAVQWTNGPGTCGGASNQVLNQTADVGEVALLVV
jgi:hypothetical protein